jgi:hypothetical protein
LSLDIIQGEIINEKTKIAPGNSSAASWQTEDVNVQSASGE